MRSSGRFRLLIILLALGAISIASFLALVSVNRKNRTELARQALTTQLEEEHPGVSFEIIGPYNYTAGRQRLIEILDVSPDKLGDVLKKEAISRFLDQAEVQNHLIWEFYSDGKSWKDLRGQQGLIVSNEMGGIVEIILLILN